MTTHMIPGHGFFEPYSPQATVPEPLAGFARGSAITAITLTIDVTNYAYTAQDVSFTRGFGVTFDSQNIPVTAQDINMIVERYRNISFSELNNDSFLDWGTEEIPAFFNACQSLDDPSLKTQVPYVYTFLKEGDETSDGAFMGVHWDWITPEQALANSPRAQDPEQIYVFRNGLLVGAKKTRVRGKGRSVHLQFTSDGHKNFDILGWAVFYDTQAEQ